MKNETLKQIISQIKKYELIEEFQDVETFKKWASNLNITQINNFISLNIELEEIRELKPLLINNNLLNCKDYNQKVTALSALKNCKGCWHLRDCLCSPNFLNSKNFYKDIKMLSKADTARYGLWILAEDTFINSPYHDEDLKLLVETHDTNKEEPLDFIVSDAIATVAANIDSIKSPYHEEDMKLIAASGSDCLQSSHSYPESSLNNLAVNKVSLSDKYHLENMKILSTNPIASEFLYKIMTDPKFIKSKNYREEIKALANAKSKLTARALYYYIVNPKRKFDEDTDYFKDTGYEIDNASISSKNSVAGNQDPDYLNNLIKINEIDDKFVMHYVSLLMNSEFLNIPYKDFDLKLLQSASDKLIFMDLYRLMTDEDSLNSIHHKNDATIISQITVKRVRDLLLQKARYEYSLKSSDHEYDMKYISKLNLDDISEKMYDEMYYYIFTDKGMDDPQRKEKLERLAHGILEKRSTSVSSYLDSLEKQIENSKNDKPEIIKSVNTVSSNTKTKILKMFKK